LKNIIDNSKAYVLLYIFDDYDNYLRNRIISL